MRLPNLFRFSDTFSELSRLCITSMTVVRCDHRRTDRERRKDRGSLRSAARKRLARGTDGSPGRSPSVSRVLSIPMKLLPGPYRTGSTCVWEFGWIDEVIAGPWE